MGEGVIAYRTDSPWPHHHIFTTLATYCLYLGGVEEAVSETPTPGNSPLTATATNKAQLVKVPAAMRTAVTLANRNQFVTVRSLYTAN